MSLFVMAHVFRCALDPTDKLVLLAISDATNDDGEHARLSLSTLAAKSSMTENTVRAAVNRLLERRLLSIAKKHTSRSSAEYKVNVGALTAQEQSNDVSLTSDADRSAERAPARREMRTWAELVVRTWNETVTDPIPRVRYVTDARVKKIWARRAVVPELENWKRVFAWANTQDWCRAPGRNPDYKGDHGNWVITLDWLVENDTRTAKFQERSESEQARLPTRKSIAKATRTAGMEAMRDRTPYIPEVVDGH